MLGLGWLSNQIGRLGGAIKGGFQQRMGQFGQQGEMGRYRTPDFNPNARAGMPSGDDEGAIFKRPMPRRMETPELQELSLPGRPTQVPQQPITPIYDPTPERPPQMAIRDGQQVFYNSNPQGGNLRRMMDDSVRSKEQMRETGYAAAPMMAPPVTPMPETYRREAPGARVEDVRIPSLPGIPGGPQPYDPIAKERFDYIYSRIPKDEDGVERKWTRGERFKAALMPALAGAVRGGQGTPNDPLMGMLGGAGTGFAVGAVNPNAGSQISFNTFTEPRLLADQARREGDYMRGVDRERAGLGIQKDQTDIEYRRAQTEATRAGMKDAQLEREYRRSQISLNDARAQAVATGKPQVRDIVDETGQIRTYAVYPDGSAVPLGGSARAAINTQNVESREKVAEGRNQTAVQTTGMRQAGATGRTAMTQAGQDRRAAGTTGSAPAGKRQAFIDRAVKEGYSRAEAEAFANSKGIK